jgi:hypothetical protein
MNIDRAALQIAGPLTRYTRTGDSGRSIHRNFCTHCGTTLLTEFDVDPEHVSIKAARSMIPRGSSPTATCSRLGCNRGSSSTTG